MRLAEQLGVRGVGDLAVEGDHVAAQRAERRERLAVGLAGGLLLADVPGRQRRAAVRGERVRGAGLRRSEPHVDVALPAELGDRVLRLVERLPVLAGLVLDGLDALALHRLRDDDRGAAGRGRRGGVGRLDRLDVVAVDRQRLPAEGLGARDVAVEVPSDHRLARLAEPVDVDDRGQVVQAGVRRVLEGLPHRALGHLGVAAQAPHPVGQAVEPLAGQRHADRDRQALAERAGGDVGGRDPRRRVAFEPRVEPAEREQLGVVDDPRGLEHRVVQRRRVALGEDQVVVGRIGQILRVHPQMAVEQHGHQVGGGHRRRGMARAGRRAGPHGVHAQLLPELAAAVGVAHAATRESRLASTSAKSCWKDFANFSTPSRSSVSTTSS